MSESEGVINGKHQFPKIVAKSDWSNLKVGSKLKFLLFEGSVRHMELLDASWDEGEEEVVIPTNENIAGYDTELRHIKGTVVAIHLRIVTVQIDDNKEQLIDLDDFPKQNWDFMVGDNVSMSARFNALITQAISSDR